jgi:hypothetical protein
MWRRASGATNYPTRWSRVSGVFLNLEGAMPDPTDPRIPPAVSLILVPAIPATAQERRLQQFADDAEALGCQVVAIDPAADRATITFPGGTVPVTIGPPPARTTQPPRADDDPESAECPFCYSGDGCEHLLLLADLTFHEACGGALYDALCGRYAALREACGDEDDDSHEDLFDALLDEVYELATCRPSYYCDPGPGQSSAYHAYYATVEEVALALRVFTEEEDL